MYFIYGVPIDSTLNYMEGVWSYMALESWDPGRQCEFSFLKNVPVN